MAFCKFCLERHAILFTSSVVNGQTINDAYCLKCAYQSKIPSIIEQLNAAGINDDNIDEMADKLELMCYENNINGDPVSFFRDLADRKSDIKPFSGSDAPLTHDTEKKLEKKYQKMN